MATKDPRARWLAWWIAFLARSRLAVDEHRRVRGRHAPYEIEHLGHSGRSRHQPGQGVAILHLRAEVGVLAP
jgi:hypothetical protein